MTMPLYEYQCTSCGSLHEVLRAAHQRNATYPCSCGGRTCRVPSSPALSIWDAARRFPNLSPHGDGTAAFPSKAAYESHLKKLRLFESRHDGVIKRPHGNKVIRVYR